MKRTHIPNGARTFCGRLVARVEVIDMRTTCLEDATCQACQRSDDARQRRAYEAEARKGNEQQ